MPLSIKVPYASRISYRVPSLVFSLAYLKGALIPNFKPWEGRLFEAGLLVELGADSSINDNSDYFFKLLFQATFSSS